MLETDKSKSVAVASTSRRRSNSSGNAEGARDANKDEEAVLQYALKKSLEVTCNICKEVFPKEEDLQIHYNLQHVENRMTLYEEKTAEEAEEVTCCEPVNAEDNEVETETALHGEVEEFVRDIIVNARQRVQQRERTIEAELRDEIQQLKNSMKVLKADVAEKDVTIQTLEAQVLKLEEKNKTKQQEYTRVKKNLLQHQLNEQEFKEKAEKLESENSSFQRTITQLNQHLEHLQSTIDMTDEDEDGDDRDISERSRGAENNGNSNSEQPANQQKKDETAVRNKNHRTDTVKIKNYGGGVMSVENMEKLLGLKDAANIQIKNDFHITVSNDSATVQVPKHLTKEILLFNDIDINGKKLEVELIESTRKYCYYFQKGRCENGDGCRFVHEQEPCRFFLKGTCNKENTCKFRHDQTNVNQQQPRKRICKFFKRGRCTNDHCDFEHPVCHSFRDNVECKFGKKCRFVCYKDRKNNNPPEQQPAAPTNNAQQHHDDATGRMGIAGPTATKSAQQMETTGSIVEPATQPQVNFRIPTGIFGIPQGSQWTQQKGNIGGETNNPLSFLGQKVEGLERTVSHLLQMLKPAYCPPPIPQFQAIR